MGLLGAEMLNIHLQRASSEHDLVEAQRTVLSPKTPSDESSWRLRALMRDKWFHVISSLAMVR